MNDRIKSGWVDTHEYNKKYIQSDYYMSTEFDSRIVDNFLSDGELKEFDTATQSEQIYYVKDTSMSGVTKQLFNETEEDHITAHYNIFANFYTNPAWSNLVDIIQPKLEKEFGNGIKASHIHVLDSHFPYGLHNDAEQPNMNIAPNPAWTLIIPFNDYPSKTYVFNERCGYKDPWSWIDKEGIKPNDNYCIDLETYEKDFSPITGYEVFKYLTVESTFEWKRGSCFAADRYRYHCSDNYYNHGIKSKKAIIMWTSVE
jgi:hypothetical protein